jgi:hypothetical protein
MAESVYETVEELEEKIRVVIEAIAKSWLIVIFREWENRVYECIKNKGDDLSKLLFYVFSSQIFLLEIESPET